MFAHLKGIIDTIAKDHSIIDVGGVGYCVYASRQTLSNINEGDSTKLFIETLMRQESLTLFGFLTKEEQAWFNLLLSVQGVGPKVALGILGSMTLNEITQAIACQDKSMIGRADGVGPKLAGRILLELKDKFKGLESTSSPFSFTPLQNTESSSFHDAYSALLNLGYTMGEASKALGGIDGAKEMDSATLIRLALQSLQRATTVR